jgi:hypothetical protein
MFLGDIAALNSAAIALECNISNGRSKNKLSDGACHVGKPD